jgi:hypothetical protein
MVYAEQWVCVDPSPLWDRLQVGRRLGNDDNGDEAHGGLSRIGHVWFAWPISAPQL